MLRVVVKSVEGIYAGLNLDVKRSIDRVKL